MHFINTMITFILKKNTLITLLNTKMQESSERLKPLLHHLSLSDSQTERQELK